jgi:hypothetical protein
VRGPGTPEQVRTSLFRRDHLLAPSQ